MTDEIKKLKRYSKDSNTTNEDKILIDMYHEFDNDIEFGCCNNLVNNEEYEVYMFVANKEECASRLGLISTKDKEEASNKFVEYKNIVKNKNIDKIKDLII